MQLVSSAVPDSLHTISVYAMHTTLAINCGTDGIKCIRSVLSAGKYYLRLVVGEQGHVHSCQFRNRVKKSFLQFMASNDCTPAYAHAESCTIKKTRSVP